MSSPGSLSVVTTVRNAIPFIDGLVDAVPPPLRSRVRHVIADGGSDDGTYERLRVCAAREPHLVVLEPKHDSIAEGLNRAIGAVDSSHIVILNADDGFEPGGLEALLRAVEAPSPPSLVIGGLRVLDERGETFRIQRVRRMRIGDIILGRDYPWNPACLAYARSLHLRIGEYDEREPLFDLAWWLRLSLVARPTLIEQVVGCFNMQPQSLTVRRIASGELEGMIEDLFARFEARLPIATRLALSCRRVLRRWRRRQRP
ncbi:MAG: glycosyltransferase [Phycisphaerales bacterium]|jgi:glycosyltransferase involved in cell wall biosynthesis